MIFEGRWLEVTGFWEWNDQCKHVGGGKFDDGRFRQVKARKYRLVLKSRLIAFLAISLGILESTCFNVATALLNSSISTVFVGLGCSSS